MGWLSGWAKRVKITIDAGDIDADLTHFPVLLYLSSSSGINAEDVTFIFDEIGSNYKKIAVTKDDGETPLYVEVEKWDAVNEKAWLWISKSDWVIDDTVDTDIYLYYDNSQPDNDTYVGDIESTPAMNVWDANFKQVHHLRDKTTSSVADSTSNNKDGTKTNTNEPQVITNGKIDDAQDFDGVNDRITTACAIPTVYAVEFWLRPDALNAEKGIHAGQNNSGSAEVGLFSTNKIEACKNWSDAWLYSTTVLSAGVWYHVVFAVNNTSCELFINGVSEGTYSSARAATTDTGISIGRGKGLASNLNCALDEVRFSNSIRSAAWWKANYESGRDHLLDWGTEETPVVGVASKRLLVGIGI